MRVLVCGSRSWTDRYAIERELRALPDGAIVIHGAARGADTIAGEIANRLGLIVETFPADWKRHGRAAGHIRKRRMLEEGKPDLVLAFDLGTPGTADMMRQAQRAGLPVHRFAGKQ